MSGGGSSSAISGRCKDLARGAGKAVALTGKENFERPPHPTEVSRAMKVSREFPKHPQAPVLRQNIKALRHASSERGRKIIRGAIAWHVNQIRGAP